MTIATTTYITLAQLIDSALPIGGFSHSFGLESFVQTNRVTTNEQLKQYIKGQLTSSLIPFDCSQITQLYTYLQNQDFDNIIALNQRYIAQKLARESREATCKMGKRLLKLGQTLFPQAKLTLLEQLLSHQKLSCSHTTVFAWLCFHLDIPLHLCIHGYLYTAIQGYINSGLRLISLGQTDGQLIISQLQHYAIEQWLEFEKKSSTEPYSFSFVQDIMAMKHEKLYSRLFMS